MKVTILGIEYECRPLSAADRLDWNLYLHNECLKTYYSDLHKSVEHLPGHVQDVVMRKHSPPARLDASNPLYYKLARTPVAVGFLLDMMIIEGNPSEAVDNLINATESNATEILLAVHHLTFKPKPPVVTDTEEKQKAALETFANLEEVA